MGHQVHLGGDFGTGGAKSGTPGEVGGRLGGDSETGGAESGTPGTLGRGFRDRWGWKWDTGRTWAGISGQVGRKMGHRARLADLRGRLSGEALDREGRWGRRVRRLIRC